ncbi:Xanthan lyase precursor [Stieleria maiorica]|uniref:Xanthan lyase n=1 Tax=Stieleria maiorica TaxID=2795974 RepID=A0A5B9M8K7_9BACT|nr:FAD-dependent oxidoreductase [Stieleria maiorica]QEF96400.1 Xanthan lyase precursor [Stieleria maiorica]
MLRSTAHLPLLLIATLTVATPLSLKCHAQTAATAVQADVCVYGGTSGGVVAAVQVARMGKRVVLVEPGRHLGGMTSGGLSAVDIGDPRSVGGLAREYFTRLVATYGKELNWGQPFRGKGGPATGGAYSIEPHVAEQVFDSMVAEAGVVVLREARLESVRKSNNRIGALVTEDGRSVSATMFIDTTYEGDLMAAAGVSYTLEREGNAKYGEQYNGIHYAAKYAPRTDHPQPGSNGRVPGGQGVWDRDFPLDPYVVKGDPSSGLLPLVSEGAPGNPGDPAPGVMAYCFRLCLTTDASNMLPIEAPENYDPKRYELVARFIEACLENGDELDLRWFSKHDPLPNDKWDFNTATFGGNLPGASWEWPEASYDRRERIAKEIENYHRGLFHFLATDPRVPAKLRKETRRFGLPKDEFTDNGGWPHQIYVREGRRMVSDLVLTEHHTFGREIAPRCIGLGSYGTDVHEIRRIVKDSVVMREGKVASGRGGYGPYDIGYGAIVPKQAECENLLVTFALSASHTAFASIRMEPVLMVTSQSAATAACQAIDANVSVQQVDYDKLRKRLIADGQVLEWKHGKKKPPRRTVNSADLPGIAVDDDEAVYTGHWVQSSGVPPMIGNSYRHDANTDRGKKSATFAPDVSTPGRYEVRLLYTPDPNRSSAVKVVIHSREGMKVVSVNQKQPAMVDGIPRALGVFDFDAGNSGRVIITNEDADGYVNVDGIQLVPIEIAKDERMGKRPSGYVEPPSHRTTQR